MAQLHCEPTFRQTPSLQSPTTDQALIALWLHGRRPKIRRAYTADADQLTAYAQTPLSTSYIQETSRAALVGECKIWQGAGQVPGALD